MSEADEDKPKHCNLASMLYDLGLYYFLAVGLCIEISTGLLYYRETSQRMVVKDFVGKVTMGLDYTAKAVNHVKIESI